MLEDWEHLPQSVDASYIVVNDTVQGSLTTATPKLMALDTENDEAGTLGTWSVAYRDKDGELLVSSFYKADKDADFGDCPVVMHNAKWDLRVLRRNGMREPTNILDTMIASYCMGLGKQDIKDTGKSGDQMVGGLGLKYLARRNLGMRMKEWKEVFNKPEEMQQYNAEDSVATYLLFEKWKPNLPNHFWNIDMPLLPVLMAMEDRGIMVDPDFLRSYAENLDERLAMFDLPLNPYSVDEVRSYVYGTLGLEPTKFTDTGAPSIDSDVLETIDDPVVKTILEYKSLSQEKNTYVSNYTQQLGLDGRIRTEFKQTSTATGRLSSVRPNLQNVTKGNLRSLFIAPEGKLIVRADYNQLELRTFAALTQDPSMLEALARDRKIHQDTADRMGMSYDDAKVLNFLMLYAGTAWKISQEFHIPIDKGQAMIDSYYKAYPGIRKYHNQQIEIAQSERKVYNYFGRLRRLDSMYAEDWRVRREGEREAINTPIQGTGGEVVKLGMIDLHEKHSAPMILQVHDELLFEVDEREAKEYAHWLEEYIPTLVEINGVRFTVDVGIGKNWLEAAEKENNTKL